MTKQAPAPKLTLPEAPQPAPPTDDELRSLPRATPLERANKSKERAVLESDTQSHEGETYQLTGNAEITYAGHTLRADRVRYDAASGEVRADGHVRLSGSGNGEYIQASRAVYNLRTDTGRFFDVQGSVTVAAAPAGSTHVGYTNGNPFLFTGKLVVKTGPQNYDIYEGTVTSCLMPNPDWLLSSAHLSLNDNKASASKTIFHLLGLPVLFLPYVTYPSKPEKRQSGLLIPLPSYSNTKGFILGEGVYVALGRSSDLTATVEYFSRRGFSESGTFRQRGTGVDFLSAHVSALQDRGYIDATTGDYVNQGGEDVTASFRHQLTPYTRAVGDAEYLSSYIYREAFTNNFNQAVSSDITSQAYVVRERDGIALDGRVDRYQGLKRVQIGDMAGQQVRIFHAPSLDLDAVDHRLGDTPLLWSLSASAAGLKRSQPNFTSSGIVERVDLRPEITLPLAGDGWHFLASVAARETAYSRSRVTPYTAGTPPMESTDPLNRADVDVQVKIEPPTIERTFAVPPSLQTWFGTEVRHTVEPELTYRSVRGVGNFLSVLRFDDADLQSDTDQLEYGLTQHLYFRRPGRKQAPRPGCPASVATTASLEAGAEEAAPATLPDVLEGSAGDSTDANGIASADSTAAEAPLRLHARKADPCAAPAAPLAEHEWFSWRVAQRHYFDPTFGKAVLLQRRNIFDATLSLSGIAFLTEPRSISPLISRMRFRAGTHADLEWDFDFDTGASKLTSSNVFADVRTGRWFGGVSYALLNAPGRFNREVIDTNENDQETLVSSPTSAFQQMRVLAGYGSPERRGLSLAANAGLDLDLGSVQYAALQSSYNWNCCGLTVEYRKYELGSVRNENAYRFSFTLANIGAAGNIRRAERLF